MPSSHACGVGVKFSCFSNAGVLPTMTGDNTIAISIILLKNLLPILITDLFLAFRERSELSLSLST